MLRLRLDAYVVLARLGCGWVEDGPDKCALSCDDPASREFWDGTRTESFRDGVNAPPNVRNEDFPRRICNGPPFWLVGYQDAYVTPPLSLDALQRVGFLRGLPIRQESMGSIEMFGDKTLIQQRRVEQWGNGDVRTHCFCN